MNKTLPRVAFWLVPEKEKRLTLQKLITVLAERYATIPFVPHLTVYSCHRSPQQFELTVMTRLARGIDAIALKVDRLVSEDSLTRALTVRLQGNDSILQLHRSLHQLVPLPSNYEIKPHLSLLYQHLPRQLQEKLIEEIHLEMSEVCFEELWAVAIPARITSLPDLLNWQTLLTCRLAPGENVVTL